MTARPLSAQELCESIRQSQPCDTARLDRILRVDPDRALVEVQACTPWRRLAAELRPGDASMPAVQTTRATIGESIAWNAAGPDGRPTVCHVESLTMVTPDGQLRRVDRVSQPMLFSLVVGGHGLFGVMYSVTLRLESLARAVAQATAPQPLIKGTPGAPMLRLLLPPAKVQAFVDDSRERCRHWRLPPERLQARAIQRDEETFLRWAVRDCIEVGFGFSAPTTLGAQVRATQLRRELIDAAIACGGSFPIACTPEATRAQALACYPQLAAFLVEQRRIDPHQRWANAWLRHHRSLLEREDCEVRWNR